MLKKIGIILVVAAIAIFAGYKILQANRSYATDSIQAMNTRRIEAAYDTGTNRIYESKDSIQFYTLKWVNTSDGSLPVDKLHALLEKGQPVFINLQIWTKELIRSWDNRVAENILNGDYDSKLKAFFQIFSKSKNPVYVSYNEDMELPITKYPWQYQSPSQYILSFRHITSICKKYAPHVKMVWSPDGYPGAEEYWPGNEFADLVSINLNTVHDLPNKAYPPYKSIEELLRRKMFRMRFTNTSVLLLSNGIKRSDIQPKWLDDINELLTVEKAVYRTPVKPWGAEDHTKATRDSSLKIGVYDPSLLLVNEPLIKVEHLFPNIADVRNGKFKKQFDEVLARQHDVIVTMEAWRDGKVDKDPNLINNIVDGKYDDVWTSLFQIISNVPQTVYLRFAHEMEIPITRYPWQSQDPVKYIKMFRYFANFQTPRANNIKMVWGPAGDRGSVEWWPGGDVVDFVSIAIYGLPDKDINDFNKQLSFTTIFTTKFQRIRFANKPIFITEFGVKGPKDYQQKWLADAAETINAYPEIKGVSYFNFADSPKAWGNAETPIWSISSETLKHFTDQLKDISKK